MLQPGSSSIYDIVISCKGKEKSPEDHKNPPGFPAQYVTSLIKMEKSERIPD